MDRSPFVSSSWYKALSLSERIAILTKNGQARLLLDVDETVAKSRLQLWQSEPQFQNEDTLNRRLALDGIDQKSLAQILAVSPDTLSQQSGDLDWLNWIAESFSHPATAYASPPPGAEELYFLDLVQPLIDRACAQLFQGIDELLRRTNDAPFDPRLIEDILLMNVPGPLLTRLSRVMVMELNIARLQGYLDGETPADRFRSFVETIRQPEKAVAIFADYPVLTRQLVIFLNQWVEVSIEFLTRLCLDWQVIKQKFCPDVDPGKLIELIAGAGDTHRGGRSVMIAEFESGFQLVYKPKSLAIDGHFQELLDWLNKKGFQPTMRPLEILDCSSYGWVEYIPREECSTLQEVSRFYERLGAYLALLYVINASDFHLENLIAMGEHPILIDLETLFNPEFVPFETNDASSLAAQAMVDSVLVVGMLPQRLWTREEYAGVDISGLGGHAGQLSPDRVPHPDALGTDEMRYVRQRMEMAGEANRPILGGHEISALDYITDISNGFQSMYRLLLRHRKELSTEDGLLAKFNGDETRVLLRPTRTYDQLLFESFHPDVLGDALQRDLLLDRLWMVVPDRPFMSKVIASEQHDMRHGDIPVFTTKPTSRTIWNAGGEAIRGVLIEDGMSIARRRLEKLGENDLHRQKWFILSTLATLSPYEFGITPEPSNNYLLSTHLAHYDRERLLAGARCAANELVETAIRGQDDAAWIGLEHLGDGVWDLAPVGADLYSGLAGIALFLAYAGSILEDSTFTELARAAFAGVRRHTEIFSSELPEIGAFLGWGGVIYLATHLAALWNETKLLVAATDLVRSMNNFIRDDDNFVVFDGAAGAIMPLLALYRSTGDKVALETAVVCGEHLLAYAQPMETGLGWISSRNGQRPLLGFAHGVSGIATALLQLAEISGQQNFREVALQAIAYERSYYSPLAKNWPDLRRVASGAAPNRYHAAWCHGAIGIGLSRMKSMAFFMDDNIPDEIDAALEVVINQGFGHNHSLCHGDMGSLDFLLVADQKTDHTHVSDLLHRKGAAVLSSIERAGWQCGGPMAVKLPGLMTGIAGIGYQLLRLAEPQRVPSILLLEHPSPRS